AKSAKCCMMDVYNPHGAYPDARTRGGRAGKMGPAPDAGKRRRNTMSHSPRARLRARRFAAGLLAAAMTASCIPAAFAADNDASKSWTFTWFGPSTSETANTVSAPDGIGGKIVMTSCTSKEDGTIDKKGGKFVSSDPADGISFYYTTIDPARENFYLQADVTLDYVNPTPD